MFTNIYVTFLLKNVMVWNKNTLILSYAFDCYMYIYKSNRGASKYSTFPDITQAIFSF